MGLYLEYRAGTPPTKHNWLVANGREVTHITAASPWLIDDDMQLGPEILCAELPGHFEAVAIIWSTQELKRMRLGRPDASWWRVPLDRFDDSLVNNIGKKAVTALKEWRADRA